MDVCTVGVGKYLPREKGKEEIIMFAQGMNQVDISSLLFSTSFYSAAYMYLALSQRWQIPSPHPLFFCSFYGAAYI